MDMKGDMAIKPKYDSGSIFVDGIAPVRKGDKCGFIDKQGDMVINPDYEWDQRSIDMFVSYYTTFKK
jgi:hypothetical protein